MAEHEGCCERCAEARHIVDLLRTLRNDGIDGHTRGRWADPRPVYNALMAYDGRMDLQVPEA